MDFDAAFEHLIGHEGGYVNNPADPGGETKYGISKRSYPHEDIKNLTLDRAKQLARRDFWDSAGCPTLPDPVRFDVFDTAYNSGPKTAIKLLQRAVGVGDDGDLGPRTLMACQAMQPFMVVARLNAVRLLYMTDLGNWRDASRGWVRRCATNILSA